MRKLVNNKVVDIDNITLFELAAEGLARQQSSVSTTSDGLDGELNSEKAQEYIKLYDILNKSLTYPLHAIDTDIKYSAIGTFIRASIDEDEEVDMWIDNGLNIRLDNETGLTLKLINSTWSIIYDKEEYEDNTDLSFYEDEIGYKEYKWVLEKVAVGEVDADFYKEFMPEFVEACNNSQTVFNWEIQNILTFSQIPDTIGLVENSIIDKDNDCEYILDIYSNGEVETGEKVTVLRLSGGSNVSSKNKKVKTYTFDMYKKDKLEKCEIQGVKNLFRQLCILKDAEGLSRFQEFKAVVIGDDIVFTIGDRIYTCKSRRLSEVQEVAYKAELISVDGGKIYFSKKRRIQKGVVREHIYNYTIKTDDIRLSKIQYVEK